jgi:tyrosyl-tRNA synthetase
VPEIDEIEAADKASGGKPEAQRILAEEATRLVHGEVALMAARASPTASSHGQLGNALTETTSNNWPRTACPASSWKSQRQPDRRPGRAGLAKSKSEARSFIQSGSVAINGNKVEALDHQIADEERLYGRFTILRRGKKNYGLVSWQ